MKIISALALSGWILSLLGCGGGGSTSPTASSALVSLSSSPTSSSSSQATPTSSAPVMASSSVALSLSSAASTALYPSYNLQTLPADSSGMTSTAVQIASRIKLGFNFGNTMEAIGGETAWGNPEITEAQMKLVKDHGFDAIRLPVSWNQYANQETAEIRAEWLDRVKQVVQYAVDNDLYVIVNIHWDGGWLENDITPTKRLTVNAKQKAFWEQIATQLRDFDEHVLFASANEPDVDNAEQMAELDSYHQTFVDAVRSTGGKNAYRVLVVQGPITDIDKTNKLWVAMPDDSAVDKLMMEIHYYSPWNFTGMTKDEGWGNQFYYWGKDFHSTTDTAHNPTWGEEDYVNAQFLLMKTQFVDKGIPVILGEFGTGKRTNLTGADLQLHLDSRAFYFKYITQQAITHGLEPFVWDTGSLFNRNALTVGDQQVLDALLLGSGKTSRF